VSATDPDHYHTTIEPWDYIAANEMDFFSGNVIKYVTRWRKKNGVEDLMKARTYIDKMIALEVAKRDGATA